MSVTGMSPDQVATFYWYAFWISVVIVAMCAVTAVLEHFWGER